MNFCIVYTNLTLESILSKNHQELLPAGKRDDVEKEREERKMLIQQKSTNNMQLLRVWIIPAPKSLSPTPYLLQPCGERRLTTVSSLIRIHACIPITKNKTNKKTILHSSNFETKGCTPANNGGQSWVLVVHQSSNLA